MISGDPAVRRELESFELAQIWIRGDFLGDLAERQRERMRKHHGTVGIPLHAIVDPIDNATLARYEYDQLDGPADYAAWLREGLAAFEAAEARRRPPAEEGRLSAPTGPRAGTSVRRDR